MKRELRPMSDGAELETFLRDQEAAGAVESTGHFTLATQTALKKLAHYQLPRENAWILKMVQAAVASGAKGLEIRLNSTDTEIVFAPASTWGLAEFESAFFNPQREAHKDLQYLKEGLWGASVRVPRPFRLALPGLPQALVWDGRQLKSVASDPRTDLNLQVSQRSLEEGEGVWAWREHQAATRNAHLMTELTTYAHVCPIPLSIDGRRHDFLQRGPTHGFSKTTHPLHLRWAAAEGPALSIPPGTFKRFRPSELMTLLLTDSTESLVPTVAGLVCAHCRLVWENKTRYWQAFPIRSCCYWIQAGIVIACQDLPLPARSVSCGLFLSAEGLPTDASGLALVENEQVNQRKRAACAALGPLLEGAEISLKAAIDNNKHTEAVLEKVFIYGGGGLFLAVAAHPLTFLPLTIIGLSLFTLGALARLNPATFQRSPFETLEENFKKDLAALANDWKAIS